MEYPKINSLWKRDASTNKVIEGDYACPEFAGNKMWRVQEKIDGTNIRIYFRSTGGTMVATIPPRYYPDYKIEIKGRTDYAEIPKKLITWIYERNLSTELDKLGFGDGILFGEGFGAGIQTGGIYRPDPAFILFDAYISQRWATREELKHIAETIGLEEPHDLGVMTMDEVISFVKSKPRGFYNDNNYILEGVIARSEPLVRFNTAQAWPVMWKLKVRDFDV
jgi:hypothetical protein